MNKKPLDLIGRIGLLILIPLIGRAQLGPPAAEFFRPAVETGRDLPAEGIYPRGRRFPISGMAGHPERDRENAFTLVGPYVRTPERLAGVRASGLKAIVDVGVSKEDIRATGEEARSVDELVETVRDQVNAFLAADEDQPIAWWALRPEELRFWIPREIEYLEKAAAAIRETDPLQRPVWMYDPGHRAAAGLAHTARHLDVVGKGMYTNYSGMRDSRVWCRWTLEQQLQAIAEANPAAIPIAVPEMFQQPEEADLGRIRDWVRHDVYLALVSGARGVVIFSFWRRPDFPAYDAYYQAYAEIARELNDGPRLGEILLFGERRDGVLIEVIEGPSEVSMTFRDHEKTYPSIHHVDIAYGRERYIFAVNSADEPVRAMVGTLPYGTTRVQSLFRGEKDFLVEEGDFEAEFGPLEAKVFRIFRK